MPPPSDSITGLSAGLALRIAVSVSLSVGPWRSSKLTHFRSLEMTPQVHGGVWGYCVAPGLV